MEKTYIEVGFDEIETTPLGKQVYEESEPTVLTLLDTRTSTTIDWSTEATAPLHAALLSHKEATALRLLALGSPVDSHTFYLAYRFGAHKVFAGLMESHAALLSGKNADSILLDGARANDLATLQIVLPHITNINATDYFYDYEGWTALHHATMHGNPALISLLLENHTDVTAQTAKGDTALSLCHKNHFKKEITNDQRRECVALLLAAGATMPPNLSWLQKFFLRRGVVW